MADFSQFGANKPPASSGPLDCAMVESWLTEAAEETLPPMQAEQLREHAAGCAVCREKLTQARRGRDWLLVLKEETLQSPADLVAKILAKTSGASELDPSDFDLMASDTLARNVAKAHRVVPEATSSSSLAVQSATKGMADAFPAQSEVLQGSLGIPRSSGAAIPAWQRPSVIALRRNLMEPRLAMVAAMAFFSITLTLNLMGVRIGNLRAADLQPQNFRRSVTRQYAEANARVVRYYENLRIVYEVESRVQQLRRAADTDAQPVQSGSKHRKGTSGAGHGQNDSSSKESHRDRMAINPHAPQPRQAVPIEPPPIVTGPVMNADFEVQPSLTGPAGMGRIWGAQTMAGRSASFLSLHSRRQFALQATSCPLRISCHSMRERGLA